jgi:hypothetical protein
MKMKNYKHYSFTQLGIRIAQDIVNDINRQGGMAKIGETFMDYGAGITWETILVFDKYLNLDYQALSPRDFENINEGRLSQERIDDIVNKATKR